MLRAFIVVLALASYACFGRGSGLFFAVAETAIVAAAVVSATEPPPPEIVYVPEPRPGYVWQPGYWTLQDDQWVWVNGAWVQVRSGFVWSPTHWERLPDGSWQLMDGHWTPVPPPPPP